jgi:hypothetical protein
MLYNGIEYLINLIVYERILDSQTIETETVEFVEEISLVNIFEKKLSSTPIQPT